MPRVGLHQVEHCGARLRPRRRLAPADADLHWCGLLVVESSITVPNNACPCKWPLLPASAPSHLRMLTESTLILRGIFAESLRRDLVGSGYDGNFLSQS